MTYESRTPDCSAALYMSEDPNQAMVIFTEALQYPAAERGAFLDRACGGDDELRRRVEALLRAHERLGNFMETPPLEEPPDSTANNGDSNTK
jgi:eukaryotic-like serine/threonine-protein kinase